MVYQLKMVIFYGYLYATQPPSLQSCSPHPSATIAMAFRASRFALRAARSKVVALGARPALAAAATGAIAAGYAFSKPSGCQAPQLVDVSGLTKVAKTDDAPWISMDSMDVGWLASGKHREAMPWPIRNRRFTY